VCSDPLTAKNVVLAGVKSVTIFDPEPVTIQDLGTQVCDHRYCLAGKLSINITSSFYEKKILEKPALKLRFRDLPNSMRTFQCAILEAPRVKICQFI